MNNSLDQRLMEDHAALCASVAHILGEASGAALALEELDRRRKAGESAQIYFTRGAWIVGPSITDGITS